MYRHSTCALSVLALVTFASNARAQTAECRPFSDVYTTGGLPYEYPTSSFAPHSFRISTPNLDQLGLGEDDVRRAIALAASTWNEQGGARALHYSANTGVTDIPLSASECTTTATSTSLVVVDPGSDDDPGTDDDGANAELLPRCVVNTSSTSALALAFKMVIYALDRDGNPNPWVAAAKTLATDEKDLVSTALHEFGHFFNLTHHSAVDAGETETQFSVMGYGAAGTMRRRDLYWRDIMCIRGLTSSSSVYRRSVSGAALGAESLLLAASELDRGWAKASAGRTFSSMNVSVDWSHAIEGSSCTHWSKGVPSTQANCLPLSTDYHVFTEAVLRDRSPATSRVLYSTPEEFTGNTTYDGTQSNGSNRFAVHQVHGRRSADGFVTTSLARQRVCTQMTGFLSCTSATGNPPMRPITSAHALAVAWHDGLSRSVSAWVHQNRSNNNDSHAVQVAVGTTAEFAFPIPDTLVDPADGDPVQSNVTPGLVCRNGFANGYDCMIAVVRQDDPSARIRIYRFDATQSGNRYVISVDPTSTLLPDADRTGNRITAFYHSGEFYLAWRGLNPGQKLQVRKSADTLTWTTVTTESNPINVGPSAVSYLTTGSNQLVYTR